MQSVYRYKNIELRVVTLVTLYYTCATTKWVTLCCESTWSPQKESQENNRTFHYFDVIFAVTGSSQELQSISVTHVHCLHRLPRETCPKNSRPTWNMSQSGFAQFECFVTFPIKSLFNLYFYILPFCFYLSFYTLCYYYAVRFCNKMFVRFHKIILCFFECEKNVRFAPS